MKKLVFLFALLLVGVAGAAPGVVSTTQTSATVEGLDCGTKYRIEIRKYTATGDVSSTADYVDAQTKDCPDAQPPSAPQNLTATGATQTSISVSWSASTDNVGVGAYHLYRGGAKVDSTTATSYTFGGLSCGTSYTLAVEAHDAAGNRSAASAISASTAACAPASCPTGEYSAQYYGNTTFSGTPVLQRCEVAINHSWGSGSPGGTVPADRFSTRWTRKASFTGGTYQFTATADDGIRVWIDGALVIDAWKDQAPTTYQATRSLTAGDHDVKVEYYENGGGAVARLSWQLSQPTPPPPASCPTGQYSAHYHGNTTLSGTPVLQRCEPAINYDWRGGSPGPNVPGDRFSTRWTGAFSFTAGSHQFVATTNDGMRVWVDGTLLIDAWRDQVATTYQATTTLTAGDHQVKVEYYQNGGGSVAKLNWQLAQLPPSPPPPPPPPPPGGEPGPIAGQGYSVKFQDDFTTLNRSVWCDRQWYEGQSPANSQYVQDGILHVVTRRSQGYPNASISSEPCGQATPKSFRHGYIEARFRWTKGNGSSPAFWLFSTAHATNPNWPSPACPGPECLSGEIDVFEGQGHQPDVYLGTIHRNSCGCYGVANQHRQGVGGPVGVDLTAGFHTYAVLWTASEVKWYLDGAFLGSVPAFDSIDQPMHLIFYQWPQSWTRDTDSTSPDELHTEVDWVKVWQK